MVFNNLLNDGQSNTHAAAKIILRMKSAENLEDLVAILRCDTNTVITHEKGGRFTRHVTITHADFYPLLGFIVILDGVTQQIDHSFRELGAVATEYHDDFYGPMDDAINAGDETDRLVATWRLADERRPADATGVLVRVLDVGGDGGPVVTMSPGDTLLARIPAEVTSHRHQWRVAVRETVGAAIGDGYVASAMTRDGCYVLTR